MAPVWSDKPHQVTVTVQYMISASMAAGIGGNSTPPKMAHGLTVIVMMMMTMTMMMMIMTTTTTTTNNSKMMLKKKEEEEVK
jgi:hypothetical protein